MHGMIARPFQARADACRNDPERVTECASRWLPGRRMQCIERVRDVCAFVKGDKAYS
jgi:hypothetical protein